MTLFQILISPMEVLLIPSRANQFQLLVEPLILNVCELLNLPTTLRKFGSLGLQNYANKLRDIAKVVHRMFFDLSSYYSS